MKKKVLEYTAVFQEELEGGFSVWVPDLPGCASQGDTIEEAIANIKEAMELYLECDELDARAFSNQEYKKQFILPVRVYA